MADRLPATREIAELPRWARVAFAGRCARRVLPLFKHHWSDASERDYLVLKWVVEAVERVAVEGRVDVVAIRENHSATGDIACFAGEVGHSVSCLAAYAISHAAATALFAALRDSGTAADCVRSASEAITDAGVPIGTVFDDFKSLSYLSRLQNWSDDTPVPPSAFGPLWPGGAPDDWPEAGEPGEVTQAEKSVNRPAILFSDIAETVKILAVAARSGVTVNFELAERAYSVVSRNPAITHHRAS